VISESVTGRVGSPAVSSFVSALNTQQAAQYTGLAAKTLEKMRCAGRGPLFNSYSRRAVRYRIRDLDDWMGAHAVRSTSEGGHA
jgi:Helix-turn-helix domain